MDRLTNVRRVIEYAWQILHLVGEPGQYPHIEAMIKQAELDCGSIEFDLIMFENMRMAKNHVVEGNNMVGDDRMKG